MRPRYADQPLFRRILELTENSPFLKERLFGLSNPQGNHGESVKEAHFHLDNTPVSTNIHHDPQEFWLTMRCDADCALIPHLPPDISTVLELTIF